MATWTQSTNNFTKILSTDSGQGMSWGIKVSSSEPVSGQSITSCKIGFERLSGSATDLVYCGIWDDETSFDTGSIPDHTLWTMRMVDIQTGLNEGTVTPATIPVDGYIGVNVQTLTGVDLEVQCADPTPAGYPSMREKQSGGGSGTSGRTLVWEMSSGSTGSATHLPPPPLVVRF